MEKKMKKIFMVLAMASLLVLASSCGSRAAKTANAGVADEVEVVVDTTVTEVAVDTTAVVVE